MSSLILYLLESSAVLAILYILYLVLLRKETFFSLNRFFLLGILVFSFLIPLLSFDLSPLERGMISKPVEELSGMRLSYYDAFEDWTFEGRGTSPVDGIVSENASMEESDTNRIVLAIVLSIYAIGFIAMLFRLIWTYHWIHKLGRLNSKEVIQGVTVVKVPHQIASFSFMSSVFVSADLIGTDEFQQILAHEKTHIKEKHSIDLLIVQLLAAVLWFNPVVWWLIKSLKTTHEYIADKKMITQGYSLVEYQSLLLRQLISNNSFGLVHNFNLSFIKKRITMMKIKKSGWTGRVKVALVLSATVLFSLVIVQCNSKVEDQSTIEPQVSSVVEYAKGLNLPILPQIEQQERDLSNSLSLAILDNRIAINSKIYQVDEIASLIEGEDFDNNTIVVSRIDRRSLMSFVDKVFEEFIKAGMRKIIYIGRSDDAKEIQFTFLFPPIRDYSGPTVSVRSVPLHELHPNTRPADINIHMLEIDLSNNDNESIDEKVYDFVSENVEKNSSKYVVNTDYDNNTKYEDYLKNLILVNKAFNRVYDERAIELFGKNYRGLTKEESKVVRKGIPRAISVQNIEW